MSNQAITIDGYILAGGLASRMGTPKGSLELGETSLAGHVARALEPVCRRVVTVGNQETLANVENIADLNNDLRSSMNGLLTALRHSTAEWILVAACDMPFVSADLFALLARKAAAGISAVVPVCQEGVPQPLCAAYRVGGCVEICAEALASGNRSLQHLLRRVEMVQVPFSDLEHLAGHEHFFKNLNTPDDYAEARALFAVDRTI